LEEGFVILVDPKTNKGLKSEPKKSGKTTGTMECDSKKPYLF
jgi:hypothetical protein